MKLWLGGQRGCVCETDDPLSFRPLEQEVSLRSRRGAVSLVCFACDDPVAQRLLPQVIVANERILPASVAAEFQASQRGNVFLVRRKSAWINATTLVRIISLLGAAVAPLLSTRHIILSMDACPVHIVPCVMRAVAAAGMHFLLIAAKTTKWMQPCDVAVFGALKHRLRQVFGETQVRAGAAELSPSVVLAILAAAVEEVVCGRDWSAAFRRCGLQTGWPTSKRFLTALGPFAGRPTASDLPTLAQLQSLFPRGRDVPIEACFASFWRPTRRAEPLARAAAPPPVPVPVAVPVPGRSVWHGRTRSTSHLALPSPVPVALGGSSPATAARGTLRHRAAPIASARPHR